MMGLHLILWLYLIFRIVPAVQGDYRAPLIILDNTMVALDPGFNSPVHRQIALSGTFGELRPNHFHAGLDIKSLDGRTGEPVYAAAKGFISRVKISAYGYGRALYLQHTNGHTSVYAHLDHFTPELDQYIKEEHYKRQRFEMDFRLSPKAFPVNENQVIAYIGNSGSSTGPHLHFEIRNSMTEEALNPLQYGIKVPDHLAPELYSLKLFGQQPYMHQANHTLPLIPMGKGLYRVAKDTIAVYGDYTGVAVKTFDQSFNSSVRLGVYGIKLFVDDQLHYQFDMNGVAFDEMRYSNAHRDYEEQIKRKQVYHRLFRLPGNKLPIYTHHIDDGWIQVIPDQVKKIKIEVYDYSGNHSDLQFYIKPAAGPVMPASNAGQHVIFDQPFIAELDNLKVMLPANTLYTDIDLNLSRSGKVRWSETFTIHDSAVPLHKAYILSIKPEPIPSHLKKKSIIGMINGNSITNCGGVWNGDWLETKVNSFSQFGVVMDTIPPVIIPIVFRTDMKTSPVMKFKIEDNFDVTGPADEMVYNAYIDGQWILMELDSKSNVISHQFDERTSKGKHSLRIQLKDDRGNERNFVQSFIR